MEKTKPTIIALFMSLPFLYLTVTDYDCEMHGMKHQMGTIYKTSVSSGNMGKWQTRFTSKCTRKSWLKRCYCKEERYEEEMDAPKPKDWLPGVKIDYSSQNSLAIYENWKVVGYTAKEKNANWKIIFPLVLSFMILIGFPLMALRAGWLDD